MKRRDVDRTFRLRNRREDVRIILASLVLLSLVLAGTVVSAGAVRRLPEVWRTVVSTAGPTLPPPRLRSPDAVGEIHSSQHAAEDASAADDTPRGADAGENPPLSVSRDDGVSAGRSEPILLSPEDYIDSWRQAGAEEDKPGTITRSHQITVGPAGRLRGRLVTLEKGDDVDVIRVPLGGVRLLILQHGALVATARTSDEGLFDLSGLKTGTAAVIATGRESLLAYAFHILQSDDEAADEEPAHLLIESASIMGDDADLVLRNLTGVIQWNDKAPPLQEVEPFAVQIPPAVSSVRREGVPATTLRMHPVRLQPNGNVTGFVRRLHPESGRPLQPPITDIAFVQNGEVVAVARTDERGYFSVGDLSAGVYAVAATTVSREGIEGPMARRDEADEETVPVAVLNRRRQRPGFAAFAVEVVSPIEPVKAEEIALPVFPGEIEESLEIDMALIDPADLLAWTRQVASFKELSNARALSGNAPTGTRTAPVVPQAGSTSLLNPPPAAGGGGGGVSFPILPPAGNSGGGGGDGSLMSPAML